MNPDHIVLERLSHQGASSSARQTKSLLEKSNLRPVADTPASVTVAEALRLWRTRLKNVEFTRQPIDGLPELIRGLEKLAPQRKVEQFGFVGEKFAATIFFERQKGSFIGSAIVERRRS
jgi:hypothetical protein